MIEFSTISQGSRVHNQRGRPLGKGSVRQKQTPEELDREYRQVLEMQRRIRAEAKQ